MEKLTEIYYVLACSIYIMIFIYDKKLIIK